MSRFTVDIRERDYYSFYEIIRGENYKTTGEYPPENAIDELGKYENLQEQIGCPLEVVFNALTNGIYDEYGNLYKTGDFCLNCNWLLSEPDDKYFSFNVIDTYFEFKLADYKKTWWLKEDKSE